MTIHIWWITFLWAMMVSASDVIVNTEYGQVRGRNIQVNNSKEVQTIQQFRGIPFGKDTSGQRRFAKPETPDPWSGIFDATKRGAACPQGTDRLGYTDVSENCLNLDITTPDITAGSKYPVMFWIHGGSYQVGANRRYPGQYLSMFDVVVVSINYRLNIFGFSYTASDVIPGNAGLWDQKMALQFVIDNIANFGGDPTRITVFGNSAGGASTGLFMISPQTSGMFQQAIPLSGYEDAYYTINSPESKPQQYIGQVAEQLNCTSTDEQDMLDCLRGVPWEDFSGTTITCQHGYVCAGMEPVVDGPGGFIPMTPNKLRQNGNVMPGPIISGMTKDEGFWHINSLEDLEEDDWNMITDLMIGHCQGLFSQEVLEEARDAIRNFYTPDNLTTDDKYTAAYIQVLTDTGFLVPWNEQLTVQLSENDAYGFVFNKNLTSRYVPHSGDVPFIWGYPMNPDLDDPENEGIEHSQDNIDYSLFVQKLFTNFAKYGNPTPDEVEDPFGRKIVWEKFNTENRKVLEFGRSDIEILENYNERNRLFWTETLPAILGDDKQAEEGLGTDPIWECLLAFPPNV